MIATPQMAFVDEPIARLAVRPDVLIPLLERTPVLVNGITNFLRLVPHGRVKNWRIMKLSHSQGM
jgi:hypothetical protein